MKRGSFVFLVFVGMAGVFVSLANAHETDQFTTPIGREFADLGPFFSQWAYDLLDQGVAATNAQIREALERGNNPSSIQTPEHLVANIHGSIPWSVHEIEEFEWMFLSDAMRQRYPGRLVSYREIDHNIYEHAFGPLDYRVFSRWFFASTIKVYGTYLGTDKLGHFTDVGISYYWAWHQARRHGATDAEAIEAAVRIGTQGPGSEDGWLGLMANGDYSNGDLAANYLGFLFYRNIAEEAFIKGSWQPPMVVRDGAYWRLADHIRRDSDFFALFITDHLDEALNPGYFDESMRPALRQAVNLRAPAILWRYRATDGSRRPRAYFEDKFQELSTFGGVDYGHRGSSGQLVSIANFCFAQTPPNAFADTQRHERLMGAESEWLGTATPLLDEVSQVSPLVEATQRLLHAGRLETSPDEFGRTPLHDAAAAGDLEAVAALLKNGAGIGAGDSYGTTALHLACRKGHLEVARLLLNQGADVNAKNLPRSTPLHEAALAGDPKLARLLIEMGADRSARNLRGLTAADIAAARHNTLLANVLK